MANKSFIGLFLIGIFAITTSVVGAFVVDTRRDCRVKGSTSNNERIQTASPSTTALFAGKSKSKSKSKTSKSKSKASSKGAATKTTVPTMKRSEFITALSENTSWSKKESDENLDAVLATIQECVNDGYKVSFQGFGSFSPKKRAARNGRNPQTGEEMFIPESMAPGFTASKLWKDQMNGRL